MLTLLATAALLATPDFPAVIQRDLDLQAPPRCTVCHATDEGGAGTAVRPFGIYLRSRGLRPFDEGSLRAALAAAVGERHSSSGGQLTDIDALKAGQDPNGASESELTPAYGCSSSGSANSLALLALVACLFARKSRARAR